MVIDQSDYRILPEVTLRRNSDAQTKNLRIKGRIQIVKSDVSMQGEDPVAD